MSDTTNDHDFSAHSADAPAPGAADHTGVDENAAVDGGDLAEAPVTTKGAKKAAPRKRATKKAAATTTDSSPKRRRRAVAPSAAPADTSDSEALDAGVEGTADQDAASAASVAVAGDGAADDDASRSSATSDTAGDSADGEAAGDADGHSAAATVHGADEPAGESAPVAWEPGPATGPAAGTHPPQSAFGLLFQPPEAPARRRASRPAGATVAAPSGLTEASGAGYEVVLEPESGSGSGSQASRGAGRSARRAARADQTEGATATAGDHSTPENSENHPHIAEPTDVPDAGVSDAAAADEDAADDGATTGARSRRRRGGRGRRTRAATADVDGEEAEHSPQASGADDETGPHTDSDDVTDDDANNPARRRRRRRRTGTSGDGEDPPGTVTRVRESRRDRDEVASVRGSTRLEAKKQRRREGREAGRRRTIITEKEFLARRESVDRVMVVRRRDGRTQIGVLEDGILVEHYVSRTTNASMAGNIYLGRVQNVLPSMEAAFVDIGRGRNAVLYAGEVNWDVAGLETGAAKRIENVLTSGESVLVQVTKDPIGHKGARLTSQISLPGRYLVYVPQGSMTGISRKLPDTERARLKAILKEIVPADAGVIVRTAAEGASEEELRRDVERLTKTWERVSAAAAGKAGRKTGNAPTLLYSEPDLTVRVIRDVFNEDFSSLVVSGDDVWEEIHAYVDDVAPDLGARMTKWTDTRDIFTAHRIDEQLAKALDRKVYLPSGGSLVIDRTEAMTVIDVNTGKFVGSGGNLEETVTKNNLEAAEEIVRQLRLRDIGGIIVIDFIDMVLESNRDLVVRRLLECLGRDRTKHQVAEVTSLGLVQMTRKRVASGLLEVFSESCEHCHGRGVVVHSTPVDAPAEPDAERHSGPRNETSGRGGSGTSESSGGSARSRRARAAQPEAKVPETPARTGPSAAQIAAAAHAAALKANGKGGAEPVEDLEPVPSPADELAGLLAAPTVQVAADEAPESAGVPDSAAALESAGTPESAESASSDAARAPDAAPAPDEAHGDDEPDAAAAADDEPDAPAAADDATSPKRGARRGGRRRGRATAPAGPPRPAGEA